MNRERYRHWPLTALALSVLALLILAGCHYSLLNRSSSLAAWSPDGSRLAVCIGNEDGESGELWLVEPQSGSTRKLLTSELSNGLPHLLAPRWAPDGETLYCARTTADEKDERRTAAIIAIDVATGMATDAGVIHYKNAPPPRPSFPSTTAPWRPRTSARTRSTAWSASIRPLG